MKKIFLSLIIVSCFSSVSFAYVGGGSNLSGWYYPEFNEYLSYNPTYDELNEYIRKAKEYVENSNSDVQKIKEAQNNAIQKANNAINNYNLSH